MIEHEKMANSDYLEQLNTVLKAFHRHCRNYPLIYQSELFKPSQPPKVIDPNTFQIRNTIKFEDSKLNYLFEEYPDIVIDIMNDLGFGLEVKPTTLRHQDANTGVFLRIKDGGPIPAGSLIGFVPGVYRIARARSKKSMDDDLIYRPNGVKFSIRTAIPHPNEHLFSIDEVNELLSNGL